MAMKNTDAVSAFLAEKSIIDTALNEISKFSDDHFGVMPDEINWSHTSSLVPIRQALTDIVDRLAAKGEYASAETVDVS